MDTKKKRRDPLNKLHRLGYFIAGFVVGILPAILDLFPDDPLLSLPSQQFNFIVIACVLIGAVFVGYYIFLSTKSSKYRVAASGISAIVAAIAFYALVLRVEPCTGLIYVFWN